MTPATLKIKNLQTDNSFSLRSFVKLMKPRVMSLVLFTCMVGMLIAPGNISFMSSIVSLIAVSLGAGAAGTLNMWYEADLDALMSRTCLRPIPLGKVKKNQALVFGVILSFLSVILLSYSSNLISAFLLAFTISFYFFVYTIWLKKRTAQNIVIGGAAGALPPVIGWTIVTGEISYEPVILFLIIFLWTPSHFWALSLYKINDYKKAKIPMLPITSGIEITKINIFVYSLLMLPIILSTYLFSFNVFFTSINLSLTIYYIYLCFVLLKSNTIVKRNLFAKKVFLFSIFYLFLIYLIILVDKFIKIYHG